MPQPLAIFCCAAPQDTARLVEWEKHLLPLQQARRITIWSELHLAAGANRNEQITRHFEQADIIVLLLSSDFFASNACYTLMEQALQRSYNGQAQVVPLLLRSVTWRDTPLGEFSCLPDNGRPITRWGNHDDAFQDCVEGIKRLLTQSAKAAQANNPKLSAQPVQRDTSPSAIYHSCFLSYAHQDEPLAQRLHTDLQAQGVRCWFAPHDMKIGAKIRSTIDQAINRQEKLLLLISEHALKSAWIEDEVEAALEHERREQREMLFPVKLDESVMQTLQAWAAKLRRTCNIGDFTNWTEPEAYEQAFERLIRDLKKAAE